MTIVASLVGKRNQDYLYFTNSLSGVSSYKTLHPRETLRVLLIHWKTWI